MNGIPLMFGKLRMFRCTHGRWLKCQSLLKVTINDGTHISGAEKGQVVLSGSEEVLSLRGPKMELTSILRFC